MKILRKIIRFFTKTRLRKILSCILAVLIFLTSIKFIFIPASKVQAADVFIKLDEGYGTTPGDSNSTITTGTITNAVWKPEEFCKVGKCLYFDGSGDYINFADNANLDMGSSETVTVEGWFRTPDITSGTRTLISKFESVGADGGYKIYINSSGFIVFGIDNDNSGFPSDSVTSTVAYDDNVWHHFAAVKNGATSITVYIDGVSVGTPDVSIQNDISNNDTFYVGRDESNTSNDWSGYIDEVKVLRSARSAAEVKSDFAGTTTQRGSSATIGPDQTYLTNGLMAYWKMDETSGNAIDSGGNGYTLTNNGTIPFGTGKFGGASGTYDGSSRYFSTASTIAGVMSISMWVYPGSTSTNYFQLASGKYITSTSGVLSAIGFTAPVIYVNGIASTTITTNTWQLLTVTDTAAISANALEIGRANGSYYASGGYIDDIRIYTRVLTSSDVQKLYNWAPGPLQHLKMDEGSWVNDCSTLTAFDSSGYGNSAISCPNASGPTEPATGKFNKAGSFDGVDDYLDVAQNWNLRSYSTSTWVYVNSLNGLTTQEYFVYEKLNGDSSYPRLKIFGNGRVGWQLSTGGFTDSDTSTTSYPVIAAKEWNHIGAVYDNTNNTFKIYLNGVLILTSNTLAGTLDGGSNHMHIAHLGGAPEYYNGKIDDFKVYNYPRTQAQIIEDMNGGHPAPSSAGGSAIAAWKFDEGILNTCSGGVNDFCSTSGNTTNLAFSTTTGGYTFNGKFAKAYDGSAGTTWASVTDNASVNSLDITGDMTLSTWFKSASAANPSSSEYLIDKESASAGYAMWATTSGFIACGIDNDGSGFPSDSATTSTDYYDGTWHNAVCVRNIANGRLELYIDGISSNTDTSITSADLSNTDAFTIGAQDTSSGTTGDEFTGYIDEVKIYPSALSTDQIKLIYNQSSAVVMGAVSTDSTGNPSWSELDAYCPPGQGSACTGPIAEWKMDENTGTTLLDSSGNINNSTTWSGDTKYGLGNSGSGLAFDGVNDSVRISPALSALSNIGGTSDSYSVSAWFKTGNTNISKIQDVILKNKDNSGAYPFQLIVSANPKNLVYSVSDGTSTCTATSGTPQITVNDNKWHFGAGVWDTTANKIYLYLDGAMVNSASCAISDSNSFANTDDISIGNGRNGIDGDYTFDDFEGNIDQARVYNYARTSAQMAWEFGHGKPTVGWWKLDDNVSGNAQTIRDSTPFGKNGTTADSGGAALNCTVTGKRNTACDLDGVNDSINVGNQPLYDGSFVDGQDFSVAGWFNRDTFTADHTIIGKRGSQANGLQGWLVWLDDATDKLTFESCDAATTCDEYMIESASTFTTTGWNHFVVVWDDDNEANTKIYINGVGETVTKTGTFANIGDLSSNARNLRIGAESSGTSNFFDGKLDELMIFSHVLSPQEVKTIYNQGVLRFGP